MLYRCPQGCEVERPKSKGHPGLCQRHKERYDYTKALRRATPLRRVSEKRAPQARKRGSTLKRTQRRETKAEREARDHFNEVVKSLPCFFRGRRSCDRCEGAGEVSVPLYSGGVYYGDSYVACSDCGGTGDHRCSGPKDAHHLVEQQWIRRNYADLPEEKLLAIVFEPHIGAPLRRYCAHDPVTRKAQRIHWHELTAECIEFCAEVDDLYFHLPTPTGAHRQSMSARLRHECPERSEVAA